MMADVNESRLRGLMGRVDCGYYARTNIGYGVIYEVILPACRYVHTPPRWVRDQISEWDNNGWVVDSYRRSFKTADQGADLALTILRLSETGGDAYLRMWEHNRAA